MRYRDECHHYQLILVINLIGITQNVWIVKVRCDLNLVGLSENGIGRHVPYDVLDRKYYCLSKAFAC